MLDVSHELLADVDLLDPLYRYVAAYAVHRLPLVLSHHWLCRDMTLAAIQRDGAPASPQRHRAASASGSVASSANDAVRDQFSDSDDSEGSESDGAEQSALATPKRTKFGLGRASAMFGKVAGGVRGVGGGMKAGMGLMRRKPKGKK